MKSRPLSLLLAVAAWSSVASTMPAANPVESTGTLKQAADRYALTQSHINLLLAQRLRPPLNLVIYSTPLRKIIQLS